jgi:formate dehydrogenase maturation protein FdhE|tara:strand:- start:907 stop:1404 length:498 start_codon:yes stop_codon:yes gene_type:complete
MNLGEYFKKFNIRILQSDPKRKKLKLDSLDITPIIKKRFNDLKLLLKNNHINVYQFYIPEIGTISNNLKIAEIGNYIEQNKNKNTIDSQLMTAYSILENSNYYDTDWYSRYIEKILVKVEEKDIEKLNKFLKKLRKVDKYFYEKTINIIKNLKENNNNLDKIIFH